MPFTNQKAVVCGNNLTLYQYSRAVIYGVSIPKRTRRLVYKGQVPFKKGDRFHICECERCGESLSASARDARELAGIFNWYIKRESLWITRVKRIIIHTLGGEF